MRIRFCGIRWSLAALAAATGLVPAFAARPARAYPGPAPSLPPAGRHCDIVAPVLVEMTPLGRRREDERGERRLRVRVTPLVNATWLVVTLNLPAGVTLAWGEIHWQAPARARVAQTRELLLKVPATGEQRVVATARLVFRGSLPMAYATSYAFNEKVETARPEARADRSTPLQDPEWLPTIPVATARRSR
jgi:hypothetical protein